MIKKIAVCGSGGFWKSSLLRTISHMYAAKEPVLEAFHLYGTESIEMPLGSVTVHIMSLQPQYLDDREAYPHLFRSSDVVVYVIREAVPKDRSSYEAESEHDQINEFVRCREYSVNAGVSWEHRPWLWVRTRDMPTLFRIKASDIEVRPILADRIPLGHQTVTCSLSDNTSIYMLWNQIISLIMA